MSYVRRPRILLLDEDELFARRLIRSAETQGFELHWRTSLSELGTIGRLGSYDAVLVDSSIRPVSATEIAQYIETFFPDLPVFLAAKGEASSLRTDAPASVVGFVGKHDSPSTILKSLRPYVERKEEFDHVQVSQAQSSKGQIQLQNARLAAGVGGL